MTYLEVWIDRLSAAHDQLNSVHAELASTPSAIGNYEGRLGSPELDSSLQDFFNHWSDYRAKLDGHMGDVLTRLFDAVSAYQSTEQGIIKNSTPQNG